MIRHLAYIVIILTFGLPVKGQEILSLQQAIAESLANNFSIRIAQKDQKIAENDHQAGNAGMLPTIDLQASKTYERENVDLDIQGAEGIFNVTSDWAKSDFLAASTQLNWTIFDGLGMFMSLEKLEALKHWGELNTYQVVENTVAEVNNAYYQIILEQEKRQVLEETLEISKKRQDFAENRYEVGKGSKLEYLAAQVDYNSDQSGLIQQQELIENAKVDLNILLGRDVATPFEVTGGIEVDTSLEYHALVQKMDQANPEVLKAMQDHNVAYYAYREEQANRYPSLSLGLAYNYSNIENEAGQLRSAVNDGVTYGLSARWNLFDGFNTRRQIQNAKIQHQSTLLALDELKLQLKGRLRKAYNNYINNLQLVKLEEKNLIVAEENKDIAIERFQLGASNSLELREAQRNLVDANSRLLDAKFSTKLAEIELLRITGLLVENDFKR